MIYVRVLMCVLKGIWDDMTPHKLHISTASKLIPTSFPLNNPYNVFAKMRGTGFSTVYT